nr:hypothetical chloroplast RF20 [Klebsormidium flaccidum]
MLSTVIGQTGDWDILASASLVALTELAGVCLYNSFLHVSLKKVKPLSSVKGLTFNWILKVTNMWKIGLVYGLFVDAFKLGS